MRKLLALVVFTSISPYVSAQDAAQPDMGDPLPKGAIARLGSSRLRHTWGVRVLAFAPGGKFLASAGEETGGGGESAIRVWEIPSGREVKTMPLGYTTPGWHRQQAKQVAVSPDGQTVVWIDQGGMLHGLEVPVAPYVEYDFNPFDRPRVQQPRGPVPLAFSPDGKLFAAGTSRGGLIVMDVKTKKTILQVKVGEFHRCAFSPDGKTLAISHPKAGLRLVDLQGERDEKAKPRKFAPIIPAPTSFAFSPDGTRLVTGELKFARIWDLADGKELQQLPLSGQQLIAIAFSADGKEVTAVGDSGRVTTWNSASGKQARTFELPTNTVSREMLGRSNLFFVDAMDRVALSTDRAWLAVAPFTNAVNLINMNTGKKVAFADGQPGSHSTFGFAFTPDSKHFITASEEDRLQIWEARTGKLVRTSKEPTDALYWVGVVPKGKQIVTLSYSRAARKHVRLEEWNFGNAKQTRQIDLGITPGLPALSPDGKWLAFGEPNDSRSRMHKTGDAILVERATGKELRHFDAGDESAPQDITFSKNGKMLATINRTGVIRLWDTATGKLHRTMHTDASEGLYFRLRFTDKDKTLVSTTMKYGEKYIASHIIEWSTATGNAQTRTEGPKDMYWCQALSPDGKMLVSTGKRYQGRAEHAEVWSIDKQNIHRTFEGMRGGVRLLGFSPDNRLLAAGSYDGTVLICDVGRD